MRLRILLLILSIRVTNSLREKRGNHCPAHNLAIENGSYEFQTGSSIKYDCKDGYMLYGAETLYCIQIAWNNRPPKCIINACGDIPVREPLRVQKEYSGALLRFSCAVMTVLVGTEVITCDGTGWSDSTPMCKPTTPARNCDFESGLCGWDHHDTSDVKWILHVGSTKSKGTGPEHDHTHSDSGQGSYMYFETSSPARPGDKAILMSPLYPANYSRSCFTFWYHILARGDVAQLQVFIKPDKTNIEDLNAAFSVKESKGEQWLNHILQVPQLIKPFQIVFVATKGSSKISDIAIDDVQLYSCPAQGPVSPITEVGSSAVTTVSATTPTIKATSQPVKSPVTTKQRTSLGVPLTSTLRSFTHTLPVPLQKNVSLSTVTKSAVNLTGSTKKTDKPFTNPGDHATHSTAPVKNKNSSELIYVIVGIGVGISAVIVVGVWVYFRRRRKIGRRRDSIEAVNPLYMAVDNDGEDMVNIWHR